ncbi:unnamed protein product [Paramecium octaurelia]|uniref:Uncharacterized protein n=1 Tax=Paramecium octaurelia TaxID=43137 RepID=A0A8S1SHN6_PAROT|nr:unnamed protein product [Paramecium octaurelia]
MGICSSQGSNKKLKTANTINQTQSLDPDYFNNFDLQNEPLIININKEFENMYQQILNMSQELDKLSQFLLS